jgi:Sporulation and spore germination
MSWLKSKVTKLQIPVWLVMALILTLTAGAAAGYWFTRPNSIQTSDVAKPGDGLDQVYMPKAEDKDTIPNVPAADTATTNQEQNKQIQIFFSKRPESDNDPAYTMPVIRQTSRTDIATTALEHLLAGPSDSEQAEGMYSTIQLSGVSNCGGKDFSLNIQEGLATFRFCRQPKLAGDLDGFRIRKQINSTLTQFETVKKIMILDSTGNCFDDMSGLNRCKT